MKLPKLDSYLGMSLVFGVVVLIAYGLTIGDFSIEGLLGLAKLIGVFVLIAGIIFLFANGSVTLGMAWSDPEYRFLMIAIIVVVVFVSMGTDMCNGGCSSCKEAIEPITCEEVAEHVMQLTEAHVFSPATSTKRDSTYQWDRITMKRKFISECDADFSKNRERRECLMASYTYEEALLCKFRSLVKP